MSARLGGCLFVAVLAIAGCGDNAVSHSGDGGPGTDASLDAPVQYCVPNGEACTSAAACCSTSCDPYLNVCTSVGGLCAVAGAACNVGTDCCDLVCVDGACGATVCTSTGGACAGNAECCTANCASGTCQPIVPGGCTTLGNACGGSSECCSANCVDGKCARAYTCGADGDICFQALDCCTTVCNVAAGLAAGTCGLINASGSGGCQIAGEPCVDGGHCCSRVCVPTAQGGQVCQVASGCRVVGEICRADGDCCGAPGSGRPGDGNVHCELDPLSDPPIGLCRNPTGCDPEGDICGLGVSARHDCCDCLPPKINCCKPDGAGVPRCYGGSTGDCPNGYTGVEPCCIPAGDQCTFSAECCGSAPCVPDAQGVLRCLGGQPDGGPVCVPAGGVCTSSSDCCVGIPCQIQPGAPTGICELPPPPQSDGGVDGGQDDAAPVCALPGQSCAASADCCYGFPCVAPGGTNTLCTAGQAGCTCGTLL
ncbi:MAG TPA: hypothetical protein VGQ83_03610 [Polyangia bacterium]|jgi:hypothetical protein